MAATLATLLVLAVAAARITRLVVADKISEPARQWIIARAGHDSWWTFLVHCPWCIGAWISTGAAIVAWWPGPADTIIALPAWLGVPALAAAYSLAVVWILGRVDD